MNYSMMNICSAPLKRVDKMLTIIKCHVPIIVHVDIDAGVLAIPFIRVRRFIVLGRLHLLCLGRFPGENNNRKSVEEVR